MKRSAVVILGILCSVFLICGTAFAYFSERAERESHMAIDINQLFGRLDSPADPNALWGTEGNPYLIYENRHLENLYLLQNGERRFLDASTVFQVSDAAGKPVAVGNGLTIASIGSEDYPFVSRLTGVTDASSPCRLSTGEYSDTSAIQGVTVSAYEGQIDVGLFGVVGSADTDAVISDLLLADVKLVTNSFGGDKGDRHPHYQISAVPHETNHAGILCGHAEYCRIQNVSVYYSSEKIKAFDIDAPKDAKYTSNGGIVGYYFQIRTDETSQPVDSESKYDSGSGGGSEVGTGTGFMFSGDVAALVTENGGAVTSDYDLQQAGDYLYKDDPSGKTYFRQGVFTFAHSTSYTPGGDYNDKLVKLWNIDASAYDLENGTNTDASDDFWVSDSYTFATQGDIVDGYEYELLSASSDGTASVSLAEKLRTAKAGSGYRVLIVAEGASQSFVLAYEEGKIVSKPLELIRETILDEDGNPVVDENGEIQYMSRLGIPQGKLYNYSAVWNDSDYVSFAENGGSDYLSYSGFLGSYSWVIGSTGKAVTVSDDGSASFAGLLDARIYFSYSGSSFDLKLGDSSTKLKYYRIALSTQKEVSLQRAIASPADPSADNTKKYDLSQTVLYYNDTTEDGRMRYDLVPLNELGWRAADRTVIQSIDTALVMAQALNYKKSGLFGWSLVEAGLVSVKLGDLETLYKVPKGSVAFQVQGTGVAGDVAKINVIVATDPSLGISQSISCWEMKEGGILNINNSGTVYASFPLPRVPGATEAETTPVWVKERSEAESAYRRAYTNLNTVLVARTIEIPCEKTTTYFLGADTGAASFVYFSVDSVAADGTRNGDHENELFFSPLNGVDYVYSVPGASGTEVSVVGHGDYVQSLIVPYFGMASSSPDTPDDLIALANYNLKFCIFRKWTGNYGEMVMYTAGETSASANFTDCTQATDTGVAYADRATITEDASLA